MYTPVHAQPQPRFNSSPPFRSSVSPPVRTKQQSPYMGLEALVQAATQEQRRLEANGGQLDDAPRRASHSPVIDRAPPVSAPAFVINHRRTSYPADPDPNPNPRHLNPPSPEVDSTHSRNTRSLVPFDVTPTLPAEIRPPKKQRLSSSPTFPVPMRLSGPGTPAYPAMGEELGHNFSRRSSGGSAASAKPRSPATARPVRSPDREAAAKRKSTASQEGASPANEQDAHEWLLEHYAGTASSQPPPPTKAASRSPQHAAPPAHAHDTTDPDIVLELVASSLDADPDADATDPDDARVSMEVDEELLSLVDDPSPLPAPMSAPVPEPPKPRYAYAQPPPELRLSKPLTPTLITTIHSPSAYPSPLGPGSPFMPSSAPAPAQAQERGSMPPPASTHVPGKASSSSAKNAKGKKTAAPKVCIVCSQSIFVC